MQRRMIGRVFRAVRAALARIWQGAADARTAGLPAHVRNGRSAKVEGRSRRVPLHLPPQAATGFFPLAEGGCERKRESQRLEHRQGLIIFEPARPIGTKTITDKNLLSCSVADCVRDPILGASARLPFGLRAMPALGCILLAAFSHVSAALRPWAGFSSGDEATDIGWDRRAQNLRSPWCTAG